jgi:hypothetical protein
MKIGLAAITGMLSMAACTFAAEELNSRVIHDYNFFGVGYSYLHDFADLDINGHGPVGAFSFEEGNFVLGVSGGYFWLEDIGDTDVNLWDVTASLGYVVRLANNHINIIPRVGGQYAGIQLDNDFGDAEDEAWSILPGVGLSFALCNWFAIDGGYTYAYNFDSEDEDHLFTAGGKVALGDRIGIGAHANFSKEFGFNGVTGLLEFHY